MCDNFEGAGLFVPFIDLGCVCLDPFCVRLIIGSLPCLIVEHMFHVFCECCIPLKFFFSVPGRHVSSFICFLLQASSIAASEPMSRSGHASLEQSSGSSSPISASSPLAPFGDLFRDARGEVT